MWPATMPPKEKPVTKNGLSWGSSSFIACSTQWATDQMSFTSSGGSLSPRPGRSAAYTAKCFESVWTLRIQWIHEPEPPWNSSKMGLFVPSSQTCQVMRPVPPALLGPIGTRTTSDAVRSIVRMCSAAVRPSGILGTAE